MWAKYNLEGSGVQVEHKERCRVMVQRDDWSFGCACRRKSALSLASSLSLATSSGLSSVTSSHSSRAVRISATSSGSGPFPNPLPGLFLWQSWTWKGSSAWSSSLALAFGVVFSKAATCWARPLGVSGPPCSSRYSHCKWALFALRVLQVVALPQSFLFLFTCNQGMAAGTMSFPRP